MRPIFSFPTAIDAKTDYRTVLVALFKYLDVQPRQCSWFECFAKEKEAHATEFGLRKRKGKKN